MNDLRDASTPRSMLDGLRLDALMAVGLDSPHPPETPPLSLEGFDIQSKIGRGGMGEVYLARQRDLDRLVVVKIVSPALARHPEFLERLQREARLMAALRHPNIVTIHQLATTDEGDTAIVMEYVDGGSLRALLQAHPGGLPPARAMALFREIAAALGAAHALGVIHRDVKPENILLDSSGSVRVTDFGLALHVADPSPRLTLSSSTVGTVDYMAPERFDSADADARADVYSLGVICYEMLTGKVPRGSFPPPHQTNRAIPRRDSEAVMKALRPDPAARFAGMAEFLAALDARAPDPQRRMLIGALATAAISGAAGYTWLRGTPGTKPSAQPSATSSGQANPPPTPHPAPAPQPPPSASTYPASPTVPGDWQNLLENIQPAQHTVSGSWQRAGDNLVTDTAICVLARPVDLPRHYDVRVRFTRLSGIHSIALFFSANSSTGSVDIDGWGEGLCGVQSIDGRDLRQGRHFRHTIQDGREYTLLLEVRGALLRVHLNGTLQSEHTIGHRALGIVSPWAWNPSPTSSFLGLGSYQSPTRFHHFEWRTTPEN